MPSQYIDAETSLGPLRCVPLKLTIAPTSLITASCSIGLPLGEKAVIVCSGSDVDPFFGSSLGSEKTERVPVVVPTYSLPPEMSEYAWMSEKHSSMAEAPEMITHRETGAHSAAL